MDTTPEHLEGDLAAAIERIAQRLRDAAAGEVIAEAVNEAHARAMGRQQIPVKTGASRRALTRTRDAGRRVVVKTTARGKKAGYVRILIYGRTPGIVYRRRTIPPVDDLVIRKAVLLAVQANLRARRGV